MARGTRSQLRLETLGRRFHGLLVLACLIGSAVLAAVALGSDLVGPGQDGRIVFENVDADDSSVDLWAMNADGSALSDLTPNTVDVDYHQPSWSPDGRRLAFVGTPPGQETGLAIDVMDAGGAAVHKVAAGAFSDSAPAWSPNGKLIAFGRCSFVLSTGECSSAQIVVVQPNGKGLRMISRAPRSDLSVVDSEPAWAPDGKRIVFTRNTSFSEFSLWTATTKRRVLRRIYADDADTGYGPSWSPNGKRIVFASGTLGLDAIFGIDPSGKHLTKLLQDTEDPDNGVYGGGLSHPVFSPSGSWIAYTSGGEIWKMSASGAGAVQITRDGGDYPDWARKR